GFNSEQDLRTYVAHSQHIRFVNKWKPKLKSLKVYDMIDWPTTRYQFIK
ncbi:MAG: Dabb family protein, partial [Phycisphaerales bacterium]|nr:Dabb family protein [Phycisphaerales bacterium]